MNWIEDRIRSAALFGMAAIAPFLGLVFIGLLGALLVILPLPWCRFPALLVGIFLLINTLEGIRTAFMSFSGPPGRVLEPGEAPVLETHLEAARAAWQGPRARLILAPDAWSVELTGVPRWGLFGWNRYHWYIGIYPMLCLGLRELQAVTEWETVFWSDYQGWLNLQAKRLAAYWYRVHLHLETRARDHRGTGGWRNLFRIFTRPCARWMVRQFQPFLAREFVRTDMAIAHRHGAPTLVRALCRLAILHPLVQRRGFAAWDSRIQGGQSLPEDLYAHLAEVLARYPEGADGMLDLALDGLQREAPPLLRLRLDYMEAKAQAPVPPATPASRHLLEGTDLLRQVHGLWKDRMEACAEESDRERAEGCLRYLNLSVTLRGQFPDHADSLEYLGLAFDHAPWDEFDLLLGMYRDAHPDCETMTFLSIRRSLQRGRDHAAVLEARELLKRNPLLASACHEVLAYHLHARGDQANADREWDRALRAAALTEKARQERMDASLVDPLEPHECPVPDLQRIQRFCLADGRVLEAHLLRKKVLIHADRPVFLLVVKWRGALWDPFGRKRLAFQEELQANCPFPPDATGFIQVPPRTSLWRFLPKLRRMRGLIFRR